jgi:RimJ/RimL family protein N-acetyltransferase
MADPLVDLLNSKGYLRPPPHLSTSRLLLRPRTPADLNANLAMDLDPEIYAYYDVFFSVRKTALDPRALRKKIKSEIASGGPPRGSLWVVEWKDQPGFLGLIELFSWSVPVSTAISFRFVKSAWGQGIATEGAGAVLDFGFRVMNLPTIIALVNPANRRSQRVITKIGLRLDGEVRLAQHSVLTPSRSRHAGINYISKCIVYRLDRSDYSGIGPATERVSRAVSEIGDQSD